MLTLGLIEATTLATVAGISALYLYHTGMEQLEIRARETAVLLRTAIGESLMIAHLPSVSEIVDSAFYDLPAVDRILVTDENGVELARRKRGHALIPGGHITLSESIELGSVEFGKVTVCYSTAAVISAVREKLAVILSVSLLAIVLSVLITGRYARSMTAVISDLEQGLQAINAGAAPAEAEYGKDNELGRLVASYNRLVMSLKG
jgi:methyl-accepting chemotaxis protein